MKWGSIYMDSSQEWQTWRQAVLWDILYAPLRLVQSCPNDETDPGIPLFRLSLKCHIFS